jgi:hypothetical protein
LAIGAAPEATAETRRTPEAHTLTSASFDDTDDNAALTITAPPGALDLRSALGG